MFPHSSFRPSKVLVREVDIRNEGGVALSQEWNIVRSSTEETSKVYHNLFKGGLTSSHLRLHTIKTDLLAIRESQSIMRDLFKTPP